MSGPAMICFLPNFPDGCTGYSFASRGATFFGSCDFVDPSMITFGVLD
jgi:hypothetical protein